MPTNNTAPVDEVVGIRLDIQDINNDASFAIDSYFNRIKAQMESAGASLGKITSTWAERIGKIQQNLQQRGINGNTINTIVTSGEAQIQSVLNSMGLDAMTRWASRGELSRDLFLQNAVPRGDARHLKGWLRSGLIDQATFDRYSANRPETPPTEPPSPPKDFKQRWDEAAMSVARFGITLRALEQPFRNIYRFVDQLREANRQFALLAQHSGLTASNLAAQAGAFSAFGGGTQDFANFRNSFMMEMEKRNIGMGSGGQFTHALARYGIQYNPYDFESTMRNIAIFMASDRSDAQKLMAGRMLGMSDAMIAAAKRGPGFLEAYQLEMAERTSHKTQAAEDAQELSLETEKLKASFQDLKDQIFSALMPIIKNVVTAVDKVLKAFNDLPEPLKKVVLQLGGLVAGLFLLVRTMAMLRFLFGAGGGMFRGILALLGGGGGAVAAAGGAGAAGAAGAAGGLLRGAGGAVGSVAGGAAGAVIGAAGTLATAGLTGMVLISVEKAAAVVDMWHKEWIVFATALGGGASTKTIARVADRFGVDKHLAISGLRLQKTIGNMDKQLNAMGGNIGAVNGAGSAQGVVVQTLSINVSSTGSATEVAEEVHRVIIQEFQVLNRNEGDDLV